MIEEGTVVYYLDEDLVHSGRVTDVTPVSGGFTFSIDSYGACEGPYVIASGQIGKTVFFTEKEAKDYKFPACFVLLVSAYPGRSARNVDTRKHI